jgi:uncharacterized protein (TIGR00661 family)
MRIIYGLSGQGFGHSARSKETIRHLIDSGHDLKIFTYGQSLFLLEKDFGAEKIFEIPGLVLSYKKNQVVYLKTLWENAKKISHQARHWKKISKVFSDFNPDLVITDFEPLTVLLAKAKSKPLISIDNQHQLTNTKIQLQPEHQKELLADRLIIKSMVWGAKHYLVTSFFKTPVTKKNTYLFPPIIRQEVKELTPTEGDYILVYQGSDLDHITPVLGQVADKFVVFGPHQEAQIKNITYKSFAVEEWLKYLAGAKAVIGTAGLSLMGECVYLKKPYLALPIKRQIEQIINAQYLQRLGYGLFSYDLTLADFNEFKNNLEKYKTNLAHADAYGNEALFARLDEIIKTIA